MGPVGLIQSSRNATPARAGPLDGRAWELQPTQLSGHSILIDYGSVGKIVGAGLRAADEPFVAVEIGAEAIAAARSDGAELIVGNAAAARVLEALNLPAARRLFVAIPDPFEAGQLVEQARRADPQLDIMAHAKLDHLVRHGATLAIEGEREFARRMLEALGPAAPLPAEIAFRPGAEPNRP
jgi:CPA2 family monovalent cation:H+ antiporter-2